MPAGTYTYLVLALVNPPADVGEKPDIFQSLGEHDAPTADAAIDKAANEYARKNTPGGYAIPSPGLYAAGPDSRWDERICEGEMVWNLNGRPVKEEDRAPQAEEPGPDSPITGDCPCQPANTGPDAQPAEYDPDCPIHGMEAVERAKAQGDLDPPADPPELDDRQDSMLGSQA